MKIAVTAFLFATMCTLIAAGTVLAEGGKVRGEGATGPALQYGETPFTG
jgi:hypothetical protein